MSRVDPSFIKRKRSLSIRSIFAVVSFFLLTLSVVIPNSLQKLTAATMIGCFVMSLPIVKLNRNLVHLLFLYLCGVLVTLLYVAVGIHNGAPLVAAQQVVIIYIVSPLLWIYIAAGLTQSVGVDRLVRWLVVLAYLSCATVALYFFLFLSFGPYAASFFIESPNINFKMGYSGATMFVYGSLIFLSGGFFSTPEIVRTKFFRLMLLCLLSIVALTSGRSALILSIPSGFFIGALISHKTLHFMKGGRNFLVVSFAIIMSVFLLDRLTQINVFYICDLFVKKLFSGGDYARVEQTSVLARGIVDSFGLGSGHGVGVEYLR